MRALKWVLLERLGDLGHSTAAPHVGLTAMVMVAGIRVHLEGTGNRNGL